MAGWAQKEKNVQIGKGSLEREGGREGEPSVYVSRVVVGPGAEHHNRRNAKRLRKIIPQAKAKVTLFTLSLLIHLCMFMAYILSKNKPACIFIY